MDNQALATLIAEGHREIRADLRAMTEKLDGKAEKTDVVQIHDLARENATRIHEARASLRTLKGIAAAVVALITATATLLGFRS